MRKQPHSTHTRSQNCGVGQRRNLIAKICPADNGSGNPSLVETLSLANAHQRHANGGNSGPRTARHHTHHRAQHTCSGKKHIRADDVHTVINHCRHYAAHHPRTAKRSNEQQNHNSHSHTRNVFCDSCLKIAPRHTGINRGNDATHRRRRQQHHLSSTAKRIAAKSANGEHNQRHQHKQRNYRKHNRQLPSFSFLHYSFLPQLHLRNKTGTPSFAIILQSYNKHPTPTNPLCATAPSKRLNSLSQKDICIASRPRRTHDSERPSRT